MKWNILSLCLLFLSFLKGEQHGFRKAENIQTALDGEFYFFSKVFGFKAADNDIKVMFIRNLLSDDNRYTKW